MEETMSESIAMGQTQDAHSINSSLVVAAELKRRSVASMYDKETGTYAIDNSTFIDYMKQDEVKSSPLST